jgi:hypothetical protein
MKKKYIIMYSQVLCIRLKNASHKITLIIDGPLTTKIGVISETKTQQALVDNITYSVAWWWKTFEMNQVTVTEVEIILPPLGEYLQLQEKVETLMLQEGVSISVFVGTTIKIPNSDVASNISTIKKQIKDFRKKDFKDN